MEVEVEPNECQNKWKTTKMKDDKNGILQKWKATKMEVKQNKCQNKWMTTKINGALGFPDYGQCVAGIFYLGGESSNPLQGDCQTSCIHCTAGCISLSCGLYYKESVVSLVV